MTSYLLESSNFWRSHIFSVSDFSVRFPALKNIWFVPRYFLLNTKGQVISEENFPNKPYEKIWQISALACEEWSNQKNKSTLLY